MQIIPAIDLKDGKVVRLRQGRAGAVTFYSKSPKDFALHWWTAGARRIHIVDLDGAFSGQVQNKEAIADICTLCREKNISVQMGGGIRSLALIPSLFSQGISQIILGTAAIEDPEFLKRSTQNYPQKIILSLDTQGGEVFLKGWKKGSGKQAPQILEELTDFGLKDCFALIVTDIARDGTLEGPNREGLEQILQESPIPVILAGGISCLEDIEILQNGFPDLLGVITGKAIYEGSLDLKQAIDLMRQGNH